MAVMEIAVEIGTSYTSIYYLGAGVVLREPTVVAYIGEGSNKKLFASGEAAVKMKGKTPEKTTVVSPVADGYVADVEACTAMMKDFIKRILPPSYVLFPKIRALLVVPAGLTVDDYKTYEDILHKAGVRETMLVENAMATAIGAGIQVDTNGGFIANIGGGTTEIALISLAGIITGQSFNLGGNAMDKALADFLIGKYSFKVDVATARRIKEEIGSLYANDISSMDVMGIDTKIAAPASMTVYATDVYEALKPYYDNIARAIVGVTNLCPPELAGIIEGQGIVLSGGAAKLPGLMRTFREQITFPITIAEDPEYTAILGAGRLLADKQLLSQIHQQQ